MSAKACDRCGKLIVFGNDVETDRWIPLEVGSNVYRIVKGEFVTLDPKALIRHQCGVTQPKPEQHFSEPAESR